MPSRAQIVFENLTHEGKIPVIIHVLISPGTGRPSAECDPSSTTPSTIPIRGLSETRFCRWWLKSTTSAKMGTAARWQAIRPAEFAPSMPPGRCPAEFSRVLSRIGSFTSIQWHPGKMEGGNVYPFKIRKEPKRNIRVWLQDGSGDLENNHGSWPLQNVQMANSLKMRELRLPLQLGQRHAQS